MKMCLALQKSGLAMEVTRASPEQPSDDDNTNPKVDLRAGFVGASDGKGFEAILAPNTLQPDDKEVSGFPPEVFEEFWRLTGIRI